MTSTKKGLTLEELVILKPAWLSKLMTSLISIAGNSRWIFDGFLEDNRISNAFSKFPVVHRTLVELMERFEIILRKIGWPLMTFGILELYLESWFIGKELTSTRPRHQNLHANRAFSSLLPSIPDSGIINCLMLATSKCGIKSDVWSFGEWKFYLL
ncbi:hypothetical protein Pelo_18426 [Pelomyxa schiedti]|nr:hypothetical protein Pelo_18426 [Pelomyxa schiedti]